MILGYLIASTAVFGFLGAIWAKRDLPNFICKLMFWSLAISGALLIGADLGFIVKI